MDRHYDRWRVVSDTHRTAGTHEMLLNQERWDGCIRNMAKRHTCACLTWPSGGLWWFAVWSLRPLNSRANRVCSTSVICMDCFLFPSPQLTPGSINHSIHSWLETQPPGQANLTGRWSSFCAPAGFWNWVDHPFVTQTQWLLNRCKQDWQLQTLRKGCNLSNYIEFSPVIKVKVQLR